MHPFLLSALVSKESDSGFKTTKTMGHRATIRFASNKEEAVGGWVMDLMATGYRVDDVDGSEFSPELIEKIAGNSVNND